MTEELSAPTKTFRLEEATIDELHAAVKSGQTTCVEIVQQYIERVRAYNGVASQLVTEDGAPVPGSRGTVRAQEALRFPTQTVKASTVLPDLDKYQGPPLEYGRMEATAADPGAQQQFGIIAGIPNGGQVNALATLDIRGERSVTCRATSTGMCRRARFPPARHRYARCSDAAGGYRSLLDLLPLPLLLSLLALISTMSVPKPWTALLLILLSVLRSNILMSIWTPLTVSIFMWFR